MAETKNSSVVGNDVQADAGPPPVIDVKPGWQTSEAHLTGLFGLIAVALAAIGYSTTPEKLDNAYQMVLGVVKTLGPIGAFAPILFNYVTSRGKAKSNAITATAQVQSAAFLGNQAGFSIDGLLSAIGGGTGKKDVSTYLGLAKLVGSLLPGGEVVEKAVGIGGQTLGALGKSEADAPTQMQSSVPTSEDDGSSSVDPKLQATLKGIITVVRQNQEVIVKWWNSEYPDQQATSVDEILKFIAENEKANAE